jgi:protein dithiol oxidoreductase (disulfide-forming)
MNSKTNSNNSRKTPSRSEHQVKRIRTAVIGSMLILAAVVLGLGIWYTTGTTSGAYTAGEHYRVIEDAPARRAGDPITVQEFFSYGCVHCRNFDPMIETWKEGLDPDVRFERVPATFSPAWNVLAQTYYALEQLGARERNHDRLFRAIHDTGRQFMTIESVADFVDGYGTTREAFLEAAKGPAVANQLRQVERTQRTLMIGGVPTLVVANRYVVGMGEGRKAALEIADHLIELERTGTAPAAPAPGAAEADALQAD